jgi:hypothetical protein
MNEDQRQQLKLGIQSVVIWTVLVIAVQVWTAVFFGSKQAVVPFALIALGGSASAICYYGIQIFRARS